MRDRIAAALKQSLGGPDACRTSTLRLILAALKDRDAAGDDDGPARDDAAQVVAVLTQMKRQRLESAQAYEEAGRLELAERERAECAVIAEFLPKPMSEREMQEAVSEAIAETHATSLRDMGKVVGAVMARYPGRIDLAAVGARVKTALCAHH